MDTPSPSILKLAQRLLELEAACQSTADVRSHEGARVCAKLQLALTRLTGADAFTSLMRRALALARTEVPSLQGISVESDCSIAGLETLTGKDRTEAIAALTAHLLWLLMTFIGEHLTMRLVREAWPDAFLAKETP